jgi:hypothetical protein
VGDSAGGRAEQLAAADDVTVHAASVGETLEDFLDGEDRVDVLLHQSLTQYLHAGVRHDGYPAAAFEHRADRDAAVGEEPVNDLFEQPQVARVLKPRAVVAVEVRDAPLPDEGVGTRRGEVSSQLLLVGHVRGRRRTLSVNRA